MSTTFPDRDHVEQLVPRDDLREAGQWYTLCPSDRCIELVKGFPGCIRYGTAVSFNLLPGLAKLAVVQAWRKALEEY